MRVGDTRCNARQQPSSSSRRPTRRPSDWRGEKDKADVIITINNWFDCMNSKSSGLEQANKYRSPLGTQWEHQEQAMLAMLKLMESMVRHALYFTLFKAILY